MKTEYLIYDSFIGYVLMVASPRGFCWVDIDDSKKKLLDDLEKRFKKEDLRKVSENDNQYFRKLIDYLDGNSGWKKLPFDVRSTDFKIKVWQYLQTIPETEVQSYSQIAKAIGNPKAHRAVANACATNPVPLVVPCHRVILQSGEIGEFGPGVIKKKKLLKKEKYLKTV